MSECKYDVKRNSSIKNLINKFISEYTTYTPNIKITRMNDSSNNNPNGILHPY